MPNLAGTTAVILAGGLGTRLRSVVQDRPKALVEIVGRPFLTYLFDQLKAAGLREVVVCTGYLGEMIPAALGDSYEGVSLSYSREFSPLGTGGGLRLALPQLRSDSVLVMNGDSYCQADLPGMWARHQAIGAEGSLFLVQMSDCRRFGRVQFDESGALQGFEEKGKQEGAGWINAGIYLLSRRLIESIPADRAVSIEREVFPAWIGRGLYGYPGEGRFLDIGTPETYAAAEEFFRALA